MLVDIKKDARTRMNKSLENLRHELAKIRTGRAHPSLLEHVHVDYYGSEVPIGQAAVRRSGQDVTIVGTFGKKELSEEKARHYASDEGSNPEAITGPRSEYSIVATSVIVPKT